MRLQLCQKAVTFYCRLRSTTITNFNLCIHYFLIIQKAYVFTLPKGHQVSKLYAIPPTLFIDKILITSNSATKFVSRITVEADEYDITSVLCYFVCVPFPLPRALSVQPLYLFSDRYPSHGFAQYCRCGTNYFKYLVCQGKFVDLVYYLDKVISIYSCGQ